MQPLKYFFFIPSYKIAPPGTAEDEPADKRVGGASEREEEVSHHQRADSDASEPRNEEKVSDGGN